MAERASVALALLVSLAGCTNFPTIEADVCGNSIIEQGEDCDIFDTLDGGVCRPAGATAACHWDCTERSDGTKPKCPDEWGCDRGGVCRADSGGFVAREPFDTSPATWLDVADFDGDDRLDLISVASTDKLQLGKFAVHYFDSLVDEAERHDFPLSVSRPLGRDLNDDGADDLVFTNGAVGLLPGRRDRAWVPSTFVSYQVPGSKLRSASVRDQRVDVGTALVAVAAFEGTAGVWVPEEISQNFVSIAGLDGAVDELLGGAVDGDLFDGIDSPCREVVLAFRGLSYAKVLDVCEPSTQSQYGASWRSKAVEHVVHLPSGAKLDAPPLVADLDGDGHLDLLLGASDELYVAMGNGSSLESEATELELAYYVETKRRIETAHPLIAGDISGDGIADFVLPDKVLSSRPWLDGTTRYEQSQGNYGAAWSVAVMADLNRDGFVDAVAASAAESNVTFFNGSGSPYQIFTVIPTDGPVLHLATDDFDGDLIQDLAFTQKRDPSSPATDLLIAFGALSGSPQDIVQVAQTEKEPEEIVPFHEIGIGSMLINWSTGSGETLQAEATLLQGSPDRLPFAPRALVSFGYDNNLSQASSVGLTLGAFSRRGSHDALALGLERNFVTENEVENHLQFWLLQDIGTANSAPRRLEPGEMPLPPDALPAIFDGLDIAFSLAVVAGDFDSDGRDETAWLMPEGDAGCMLVTYALDVDRFAMLERGLLHFGERCPSPQLAVKDLDEDAAPELLVLTGDATLAPRRLQVLWNDGAGNFDLGVRTVLGEGVGDVRGFSTFTEKPRDDGETVTTRIALAAENGLFLASSPSATRGYERLTELEKLSDGRSVVVTDRNGDGLPDMVVADRRGIFLLEAQLQQ